MTAENAYRELDSMPEADRKHFILALLARPEVARWVASYSGDRNVGEVFRATESAGLNVDTIDAALLAHVLDEQFASLNSTAASKAAEEWKTLPRLMRESYANEKLDTPQIGRFITSYRGGQELETIAQAVEAELPELDAMDGGLLALVMTEQFAALAVKAS